MTKIEGVVNIAGMVVSIAGFYIGAADKYNKTLTIAGIKAVNHFIKRSQSHNFYDFIHEFPRLKNNFRELMRAHYSQDIFTLPSAKRKFLEPDLLPFT
jgi:hypothetical protein